MNGKEEEDRGKEYEDRPNIINPERWEQQADAKWRQEREKIEESLKTDPERRVNVTLDEPIDTPKHTSVTPEPTPTLSVTSDKSDYTPSGGSSDNNDSSGGGGGPDD